MKQAILIYGATAMGAPEFSADLLWRTGGYSVPDPVIFCEITGKKILLLSSLEIERGAREAKVDEVVSIEQYVEEFVLCRECKKPDTEIIKEGKFSMLHCLACGAKHPVNSKI